VINDLLFPKESFNTSIKRTLSDVKKYLNKQFYHLIQVNDWNILIF